MEEREGEKHRMALVGDGTGKSPGNPVWAAGTSQEWQSKPQTCGSVETGQENPPGRGGERWTPGRAPWASPQRTEEGEMPAKDEGAEGEDQRPKAGLICGALGRKDKDERANEKGGQRGRAGGQQMGGDPAGSPLSPSGRGGRREIQGQAPLPRSAPRALRSDHWPHTHAHPADSLLPGEPALPGRVRRPLPDLSSARGLL